MSPASIVIVLGIVLLAVCGACRYGKHLSSGCCGAGGGRVRKKKVRDRDPSHYPYQALLQIDGMTCQNCAARVENALNAMEGVWAAVDLHGKSAKIRMKRRLPEAVLREAVRKAGYRVLDAEIN